MQLRRIATVIALSAAALFGSTPAHAEGALEAFRFDGSIEAGRLLPTSSTRQLAVTLQLFVPVKRGPFGKLFAGLGPRAFTQELLESSMPSILAVGLASSLRAEF